ncbi:MAG: hypothetical protein Q4A64_05175 [Porphyromonadaceae bacterium]|nr:hypothetical protein [Porphyromonadaceae bacterium]
MSKRKRRIALWGVSILLLGTALLLDQKRAEPKVTIPLLCLILLSTFHTFRPRREE